jgi:predicted peptidase
VRDTPVWVIVGGSDRHFTASDVERELFATRVRDQRTRLTVDPDRGHDGRYWNAVYSRPDLYKWLLAQRRKLSAD